MQYNQIDFMDICTLDKFVLQGLEDDRYMLVDSVEFIAFNVPVLLSGEMFQIDEKTGEAYNVGRKKLQVQIEIGDCWDEE
jgi:hypothetical protein